MLTDSNTSTKKKVTISSIQRSLFWGLMLILPIAIVPLPWDWTERGMGLVILIISTLILGLEVVKLIWEGKASVLKSSLDTGFFVILLSMLLSTLFSKDINTSIWGIDGRLGSGLVIFICILLLTISARTFIRNEKDIYKGIFFFMIGLFVNNILSILSFLGVNIWALIPVYRDLHQEGLPLVRSAKVHLLLNIVNILFGLGIVGDYVISKKNETRYILALIFGVFSILNIWLYSINQGLNLVVFFSLVLLFFSLFVLKKIRLQENVSKTTFLYIIITFVVILLPVVLLQIQAVRTLIIPDDFNLVSQVSLGNDISWMIAASTFVESFVRGLFGMGVDSYSIAYYIYKPLNMNLVSFNNVTFYQAGNELFTQFTNGGLLWLLSWLFLGFLIVKTFVADLKNLRLYGDHEKSWLLLILNLVILTIYLSSIFSTYSVLVLFVLLSLVGMRIVMKDLLKKGTSDKFVFKLWAANLNNAMEGSKSVQSFNMFVTIVVGIVGLLVLGLFGSKAVGTVYALKAESFFIEQNDRYIETIPTIEEREAFVASMTHFYSKAVQFDRSNPLYNRKQGLMYLEMVGIAAEKYSKSGQSEDVNSQLVKNVGVWKNSVIDSTRKSIDLAPSVYSNWEARAKIYTGLVGMGFYDYIADAVLSLEKGIELNPLNFELHYSMAQIYVISGEKDNALASLTRVLGINPQHIPSILLAGDINKDKGNMDVYESYLKAAKKILETQGDTNTDVYTEVSKLLNAMSSSEEPEAEEEVVQETPQPEEPAVLDIDTEL